MTEGSCWKVICDKLQLPEEVRQALAAEASPLAPGDSGICLQLMAVGITRTRAAAVEYGS